MYSFSFTERASTKDTTVLDVPSQQRGRLRTVGIGVSLFLVALAPRVAGLDLFLTTDEAFWLEKSTQFVLALMNADWAHTFQIGYPAVTINWLGGLGLIIRYLWQGQSTAGTLVEFLRGVHLEPSLLPFLRLPTVLLTALAIPIIYFFVQRLWDSRVALLGALFLAFDPFLLAHSRVLATDALFTVFMTLTVLSLILALSSRRSWKTLIMAGMAMGFAVLSKSPGLLLFPFAGMLALLTALTDKRWGSKKQATRQLLQKLALWSGIAVLTFFLFWPAMWVNPLETMQGIWNKGMGFAKAGHPLGNFFWGREVTEKDPGALFYPVSLLFRSTPVSLTGLVIIVIGGAGAAVRRLINRSGGPFRAEREQNGLALCTYIVLFGTFMSLGAKKFDRYLLPIYPAIDILAAVGWCSALGWGVRRIRGAVGKHWVSKGGVAALLILQIGGSLPHYPYYLTAYNPLVGGGYLAPQMLLVGWGEGLEEAARYLNVRGDGANVRTASWYRKECFDPFFLGRSFRLAEGNIFWSELDYVVFYINQVQRQLPDPQFVQCFRSLEAEYTVRLKGIDYAWIYKVPKPLPDCFVPAQYAQQTRFGDQILLLGYDIVKNRDPFDGKLGINLYWRALRKMAEDLSNLGATG